MPIVFCSAIRLNPASYTTLGRSAAAALELFERTTRRYRRPVWGIDETEVKGRKVPVRERTLIAKPFCSLVHFERELSRWRFRNDPKVLVVAPLAGHFSTLLRGTVRDLLPNHDVYVVEWQDQTHGRHRGYHRLSANPRAYAGARLRG